MDSADTPPFSSSGVEGGVPGRTCPSWPDAARCGYLPCGDFLGRISTKEKAATKNQQGHDVGQELSVKPAGRLGVAAPPSGRVSPPSNAWANSADGRAGAVGAPLPALIVEADGTRAARSPMSCPAPGSGCLLRLSSSHRLELAWRQRRGLCGCARRRAIVINSHYLLEADDGMKIYVNSRDYPVAVAEGPAEVIAGGQSRSISASRRRSSSLRSHEWLGGTLFVGASERRSAPVAYLRSLRRALIDSAQERLNEAISGGQ